MKTDFYKYGQSTPVVSVEHETPLSESYVSACDLAITEVQNLNDKGILRFIHITDTHFSNPLTYEEKQILASVIRVAMSVSADFILHTGDVISGSANSSKEAWQNVLIEIRNIFSDCKIPFILCRGNHDDNTVTLTEKSIIPNSWWDFIMAQTLHYNANKFVFPSDSNGYYYYDIQEKKIRIICLNDCDVSDEEQLSTGTQNNEQLSEEQLLWLDEVALNMETGWKAIVCGHCSGTTVSPNKSVANGAERYAVLAKHADKIISYHYGHTHVSSFYFDANTGIQFISAVTSGGNITSFTNVDYNYSHYSAEALESSPVGAMAFDVCVVGHNEVVNRVRCGVQDDVFSS